MLSNHPSTRSTRRNRRGLAAAGLLAAGLVVVAACGSGSTKTAGSGPAAVQVPDPAPATSQPAAAQPPAASATTIAVGTSALGPVVVDSSGRTLYRFDKDTPGSGASACNGTCALTWPPALVTDQPRAGRDVPGTLGVITRVDGSRQVTLNSRPLYRFSGDQAPGDTTGNGFGGIWHVLPAASAGANAAGSTSAGAATTSAPATSGAYGY